MVLHTQECLEPYQNWRHVLCNPVTLEVPSECWQHVGIDYVTGLSASNSFDCIQVAVDLSVRNCDQVFFDSVIRHHGLPEQIVSDHDPLFTAAFWQELMRIMEVKLRMPTAHRAQADGQMERQNRVLGDSLRCMTSVHGSDWVELLGTVEFGHATLISASTGLTPFKIDSGRVARLPSAATNRASKAQPTKAEFAQQFVERRREIVEQAQQALLDAKQKQTEYYDKRRAESDFKTGDLVLLKTENLLFKHVAHNTGLTKANLAARLVRPYAIEFMINGNMARLKLSSRFGRVHSSFNVDLLTSYPKQHERFRSRPKSKETPMECPDDNDDGMRIVER
ncbi:Gag-pol Polyprotein [Phytophthora megakarya]|uniref:Gag-pol Polyprotein n=1 Tax=Phytophthora megakarya TaxID=4795 RepID=A0A225WMB7_9STRA|nr:Gag-pol Polyprotein [Phytophthora megakarya]